MRSLDCDLERLDDFGMQNEYFYGYDSTKDALQKIFSSCEPAYLLSAVASYLRQETNFFDDEDAMDKVIQVFSNNMKYYKKNESLKKKCLSPRIDTGEFDLILPPQTLTELYVLVDFAKGHRIWLGNGSFIRGVGENENDNGYYHLLCEGSRYSKFGYDLSFGGITSDGARLGLELAVGLRDDKCTDIEVRATRDNLAGGICPLNGIHLHNFLRRNHGCKRYFADLVLSDEQCTMVAASMLNSSGPVGLSLCSFYNGGAAFATSFGSDAGTRTREAKIELELSADFPFDATNWLLLNNNLPDNSYVLFDSVKLQENVECLAPAMESVTMLHSDFPYVLPRGNSGPMRIKLVAEGSLQECFRSQGKALSFFSALETNSRLQFLELQCQRRDEDSFLDLITGSLSRNTCLRDLRLSMPFLDDKRRFFHALFQSLRNHPSLLYFRMTPVVWEDDDMPSREENEATAQCVAELLDNNHCIEEFELEPIFVDDCAWERRVTPRLRSNVYRKKLAKFDDIRSDRTRAALASDLMGSVSKTPYLLWFALQRGRSTIVSSLSHLEPFDTVDDQAPSRLPGRGTKRKGSKLCLP